MIGAILVTSILLSVSAIPAGMYLSYIHSPNINQLLTETAHHVKSFH
jgi:hypothetical protein